MSPAMTVLITILTLVPMESPFFFAANLVVEAGAPEAEMGIGVHDPFHISVLFVT